MKGAKEDSTRGYSTHRVGPADGVCHLTAESLEPGRLERVFSSELETKEEVLLLGRRPHNQGKGVLAVCTHRMHHTPHAHTELRKHKQGLMWWTVKVTVKFPLKPHPKYKHMSCLVHEGKTAKLIGIVWMDWFSGGGPRHLFFPLVYRAWATYIETRDFHLSMYSDLKKFLPSTLSMIRSSHYFKIRLHLELERMFIVHFTALTQSPVFNHSTVWGIKKVGNYWYFWLTKTHWILDFAEHPSWPESFSKKCRPRLWSRSCSNASLSSVSSLKIILLVKVLQKHRNSICAFQRLRTLFTDSFQKFSQTYN